MDYSTLDTLRAYHPAWRLLRSDPVFDLCAENAGVEEFHRGAITAR